jgi:hypothetical protein
MRSSPRASIRFWPAAAPLLLAVLLLVPAPEGAQQVGSLLSPGKLSKPHAKLEGLENCEKCHEPGKQVTAEKCLACHKPVAERIAAGKGVHRDVKGDCVSCHVEHAGVSAELRPFDPKRFDHKAETGFALDGKHAPLQARCESCHKTRSFLGLSPSCASCHKDVHQGRLGADCASCHSTAVSFAEARRLFDHAKTVFALTGAHLTLRCEQCHKTSDYRVAKFGACTDCHRDPHEKPLGACASCHTTESWRSTAARKIDHGKTGFALVGKHATVVCAACHVQPATKVHLKFGRCADCHRDPHGGVFKEDCASCHKETGFAPATFDHLARTGYPLEAGHQSVPCASCHKGAAKPSGGVVPAKAVVDFRGARKECASCHKDVHQGELGARCETCHTPRSFKVPSFQHPRYPGFFTAAHAQAACEKCHRPAGAPSVAGAAQARLFKGVPLACASCHKDPHLGQLGSKCETCHTVKEFKIASYKHQRADLAGFFAFGHAKASCDSCHKQAQGVFPAGNGSAVLYKGLLNGDCASCHKDPHRGVLGSKCASCHEVSGWRDASRAFHKAGLFPLEGKHLTVPCADCHWNNVLKGTPRLCFDCHWARHRDDRYQLRLGSDCGSCHRPTAWTEVNWDHGAMTGFPLNAAHRSLGCESCHKNQVFTAASSQCVSCHQGNFTAAKSPDHIASGFPTDCVACHRPGDVSWNQGSFNHVASFALVGVHATQPCAACHKANIYKGTARTCLGCHKPLYDQSKSPSHAAAGFPTTCDTCHKPTDALWTVATFNHTTSTTFPLVGVHSTQPCTACHATGVYKGLPTLCSSCHMAAFTAATSPVNHTGFPTTCDTCHKATDPAWTMAAAFNHTTATTFPLVGVHNTQPCSACHGSGIYKGLPTLCSSCHMAQFTAAKTPVDHVASGFPTSCDSCHRATDAVWTLGAFNHSTATTFPLVGVHNTQPCSTCHGSGIYKGLPTLCSSCHMAQFTAAKTPVDHVASGFPTTCDSCHKATDAVWTLGVFNHTTQTTFPLVGVHNAQPCTACHASGVYKGLSTLCSSCHMAAFTAAKSPVDHTGFPTTCDTCHRPTDATWMLATAFNHTTQTTFPLVGVHNTQPCTACHASGVYKGLSTLCSSCHLSAFTSAKSPVDHSGLPTTCDSCHRATDATWLLASAFNHAANTTFPLVGVHATQPCTACHASGVFKGLSTLCSSCHLPLYNATTNPNHSAAGFPTTCDNCHKPTDASWTQGTFNHTQFPITSGPHSGQPCSACHTSPSNFAVFTCTNCHGKSSTDSNHRGVSGYTYSSPACYSCHPQGRAG